MFLPLVSISVSDLPSSWLLPPVRVPAWVAYLWDEPIVLDDWPRVPCRKCGQEAIQEECTVARPGQAPQRQTVLRCLAYTCPTEVVELPLDGQL